jgi:L-iditol 2-dehydrogenase
VIPDTMNAARLHGIMDVRVESLPVPPPGAGEVLVRVEACGICPTDARKYAIGVNDGDYPFNPGHEWVGRVVETGDGVRDLSPGDLVYGDTYGGYAEYTTIAADPGGWSRGALPLGDIAVERAVFVEPLADCLHAVHDQAQVAQGHRVAVLGAGSMGLQMVAVAARAGARVMAVEPREDRRALAGRLGAEVTVDAAGWRETAAEWSGGDGPDAVIVTLGRGEVAADAVAACAPGGRVVLFAGFGDEGVAPVDLNRLHYKEIALVGSEWIGVPPHQRFERYEQALELLGDGGLALEELVSDRTGLDGVEEALRAVRDQRSLKTVLYPGGDV